MLISKKTMRKRCESAVKLMKEKELKAIFFVGDRMPGDEITGDFHYFVNNYVLNYRHCVFLFPDSEPVLLSGGWIQTQAAERNCWISDCRQGPSAVALAEEIPQILLEKGVESGKIGTNFEFVSLAVLNEIKNKLPNIELIDVHDEVFKLRGNHDTEENELIKKSAALCDGAYEHILQFLKPGVTENKIRAELNSYMIENGAEECFNLVSSGKFSKNLKEHSLPLPYVPNGRFKTIQKGEVVMLEITPQYDGYWSQMVRYVSISEPNALLETVHDLSLELIKTAVQEIYPGNTIDRLVASMQNKMEELTKDFKLGACLGHTCALDLTEHLIKKDTTAVMEPGMALIIHPSILTATGECESFWGQTYMVTNTGCECLMKSDDNLYVL